MLDKRTRRLISYYKHREKNKDRVKAYGSKRYLEKGIKMIKIRKLEAIAGRPKPTKCEACGNEGKICFDHNYKTGEFRGWVCQACNLALGHLKDNLAYIEALKIYLVKDFTRKEYKKLGVEVLFTEEEYRTRISQLEPSKTYQQLTIIK